MLTKEDYQEKLGIRFSKKLNKKINVTAIKPFLSCNDKKDGLIEIYYRCLSSNKKEHYSIVLYSELT